MKYYFLLLFFFILSAVFPQEKTLFDSNITSTGWFGSPVLKYTSIANKSSLLIGGRGGYIINHSIVVGGGMYGLVTDVPSKQGDLVNENINNLHFRNIFYNTKHQVFYKKQNQKYLRTLLIRDDLFFLI